MRLYVLEADTSVENIYIYVICFRGRLVCRKHIQQVKLVISIG